MKDVQLKLATVIKPQNLEEKVGTDYTSLELVCRSACNGLVISTVLVKLSNETSYSIEEPDSWDMGMDCFHASVGTLIMGHYDFS